MKNYKTEIKERWDGDTYLYTAYVNDEQVGGGYYYEDAKKAIEDYVFKKTHQRKPDRSLKVMSYDPNNGSVFVRFTTDGKTEPMTLMTKSKFKKIVKAQFRKYFNEYTDSRCGNLGKFCYEYPERIMVKGGY